MSGEVRRGSAWITILVLVVSGTVVPSARAQERAYFAAYALLAYWNVRAVGYSTTLPRDLRTEGGVFLGERIDTGPQSFVVLRLEHGPVVVSASENSTFEITGSRASPTIALRRGKISYDVERSSIRPGQIDEISTPHAVIRVQGVVVVALDSGPLGVAAPYATDVSILSGRARVVAPHQAEIALNANEALRIVEHAPAQKRALSRQELKEVRRDLEYPSLTYGSCSPMALIPAWSSSPGGRCTTAEVPADWTLLIDDGRGFVPWLGASPDGCVAGDCWYGGVRLESCAATAEGLASRGMRSACARRAGPDVNLLDRHGRKLARGPLAGRLVVFDPPEDIKETVAPGWRIMRAGDHHRYITVTESILGLSECYAAMRRDYGPGVACVRASSVEGRPYFDPWGGLLAEGPFAGGMVLYP